MFSYGLLHMDTPVLADQQKTYIYQLCADLGYHLENLPRAMAERNEWQERVKGICAISTPYTLAIFSDQT